MIRACSTPDSPPKMTYTMSQVRAMHKSLLLRNRPTCLFALALHSDIMVNILTVATQRKKRREPLQGITPLLADHAGQLFRCVFSNQGPLCVHTCKKITHVRAHTHTHTRTHIKDPIVHVRIR